MERILKRITFINIANSDYSSAEIAGNTCFVGTNNLGKTTLQRAILFFYNANTRGLGISASQRSFEDYYFQYPNSYIIYEVDTEEGPFHVMLYRNNKICYRFVESEYCSDFYIENNEALLVKDVLARLNVRKINYSDQIETFERYRNIIYGADPDKKYKRFALLKGNSMYHNIPLAIQSIFLSSESVVKAEFVKDCIANSISTKHTTIELKTIERQLRQFSEKYQDIETFFRKDNAQRGNLIKDNFSKIKNLKQVQRKLAGELGSVLKYSVTRKEDLEKNLGFKEEAITVLQSGFEKEEEVFRIKIEDLVGEKAIVNNKLKEAEKKQKEYERKNIQELIKLVEEKTSLQNEVKARANEYQTLTASFQDTEQQYKVLFDQLDIERKEFETAIKGKGIELDQKYKEAKSLIIEEFQKEREILSESHRANSEEVRDKIHTLNLELKDIEAGIREIKNKIYFETEIRLLKQNQRELASRKISRKADLQVCANNLESVRKESEHIREKAERAFEAFKKENVQEIYATEDEIKAIDQKLSVYQDAFFGFLQENYPGWMETIGKVCNEELLYTKDLNPRLLKKSLDGLYGVQIDLASLDVQCRSLEDLEKEKTELRIWISEKQQEFLSFQENHEKQQQTLLAALGKKAGVLKQQEQQLNYEGEQDELKEKQLELDLMEWNRKAASQKEKDTLVLYERELEFKQNLERLKQELAEITQIWKSKEQVLSATFDKRFTVLKKEFDEKAEELLEQKEEKIDIFNTRKAELEKDKSAKLKKKGVDDSHIKKLKDQIEKIELQLQRIEDNAGLVNDYRKDKRELFDHIESFQANLDSLESLRKEEIRKLEETKNSYQQKRVLLEDEKKELEEEHRKFKEGIEHFTRYFKEKPLYDRLRHIIENAESRQTSSGLIELCSQLLNNDLEFNKQFQEFKNQITDFVGRFRPENHFNFRVSPNASESECENFASQLQEFYNENRIHISIAEVAKSHGMLIDAITTKVKTLTDHKGKINRMIAKMENDFSKASFESSQLIEYIRLKSEDSENKVLRKLQKIAEFREQNPFIYGESNLFNSEAKGKADIDKKSVELLNDLLKTISEENYEEIRVQDLFELRFRIKEGKNDTGWIEKIDKVGSTGTDMLVKAVIYITLLNVFIRESTERTAQSFKVHCIIDEVGQISASYLKELISFAEQRNIYLINGLPNESKLETHYNNTYKFRKTENGSVRVIPLLSIRVKV